jgi:2-hydroxychromene-2-carboxylate isomerase
MPAMKLIFSFDFISPYAYLAWTRIHALAARCHVEVEPRAVLLAGLLNHHGQKGPAEIPAKRAYVFRDVTRRAKLLGIPVAPPPSHPFKPLLALRAVHAAPDRALIDGLFAATWGGASTTGVDDPSTVERIANEAGLDGAAIVAQTNTPEIKEALRRATEQAIAEGVFGVPTMQIGGELFWGLDSLDLLERYASSGEGAISPSEIAAFLAVKPSAVR